MREDIAGPQGVSSRPMWETLEGMVREKAQEFIQQIMEEEVTELLGREKSERRSTVDSAEGYRNGYGKPRRLAMSSGTITLRRPRVRGVEERFESRVLPLFTRRTKELVLTSSRTYLKEESSKTESPSQPNSGRMPPDTFTHLLTQPRMVRLLIKRESLPWAT